jgi:fructoselysine 6-kinase
MAHQALDGGAALAVVTCGAAGSRAYDGETWWSQPALPTDPVDTTGAGDSFIAGFLEARTVGASVGAALLRGAQQAAQTCTHLGGWPQ